MRIVVIPHAQGHTGPVAPRSFLCMPQKQAVDRLAVHIVEHPSGVQTDSLDVVLACKQYMASTVYNQTPFVVMPYATLGMLATTEPPLATARRRAMKPYVDHILKLTPRMRASPYNLFAGADHLDAWVRGTLPLGDSFDVSAVFL